MTKNQKKSLAPTPTKGKGGGKGSSKGGKSEAVDLKDLKDCPLDFRKFDPVDAAKAPNYFNIFKKPPSEDIGMEDLDGLQLELETMLSNCVQRKKHLKEESDILGNLDKYKGRTKKVKYFLFPPMRILFYTILFTCLQKDSEVQYTKQPSRYLN